MVKIAISLIAILLFGAGPAIRPQTSDVNKEALQNLLKRAEESRTDAMVIFKDSKLVGEWYFNQPRGKIELMSCTKSIVDIAIGRLIDQGKIKSVDQPVYEFYPEWNTGKKRLITIRHLLNHTSGLQNVESARVEIYPSPDFVKLALNADLSDDPGTKFSYNNKAVNLLTGIVQIASGKRMDDYFRDEIFQPMGITDFTWAQDKAGNPRAMAGLQLRAVEFAKFGLLILNKGMWEGKRIVSEKWIDESLRQGQPFDPTCGLLWWRIPGSQTFVIDDEKFKELETAGVNKEFLTKLEPIRNKTFESRELYRKALAGLLGNNVDEILIKELGSKGVVLSRKVFGDAIGYNATGDLGQYLVIYPQLKIVAVRQIRSSKTYDEKTDLFDDFFDRVRALAD